MFTGIIESLGKIHAIETHGTNKTFWIESPISSELKIDQSISHNGACLTVEEVQNNLHRVTAIEELSKKKTEPIRKELVDALDDKDPGVRAAAAKALGEYHDKATANALLPVFEDTKPPVRLTTAAAYIRSTGVISSPKARTK